MAGKVGGDNWWSGGESKGEIFLDESDVDVCCCFLSAEERKN